MQREQLSRLYFDMENVHSNCECFHFCLTEQKCVCAVIYLRVFHKCVCDPFLALDSSSMSFSNQFNSSGWFTPLTYFIAGNVTRARRLERKSSFHSLGLKSFSKYKYIAKERDRFSVSVFHCQSRLGSIYLLTRRSLLRSWIQTWGRPWIYITIFLSFHIWSLYALVITLPCLCILLFSEDYLASLLKRRELIGFLRLVKYLYTPYSSSLGDVLLRIAEFH